MHDLSRYIIAMYSARRTLLLLLPFKTGTESHDVRSKRVPTIPVLIGKSKKMPTIMPR